ncbi:MAG: hypothetical protein A2Y66_09175 [Nitrospirae bacterium RBG_13_41_22]|nr:MAG: hypothetical protein A2Y66_09175 [Nitrospirae bacterium RBG_13_41_22]
MFCIIGLTACAALFFIGIAYWFDFDLGAEMTWKLLIAAGGIVILCLIVLVGSYLMPFTVKITDEEIVVDDLGDTPTVYRFKTIDHCETGNMLVGSETYSVLVIELKNGDREIIGVAPAVSKEVLRQTLGQRGVNVLTRSDTLSERALEDENGDPYSHSTGIRKEGK